METAPSQAHAPALPGWISRFRILLVASWAALYLPRLFVLGLYIDDWWALIEPQHSTAPFSLDRLHYFVGLGTNYGPRPLLGFFAFLVTSIAGPSPAALQLVSALLVLAAALSLRAWLNSLMRVLPEYRETAADLAAIFWMSLPWLVGTTAWPMVAHNILYQIVFTETARLLLARERATFGTAALVTLGVTVSGLIYEAFYLGIFPVILLYAICGRGPAKNKRQAAALFGIGLVAQAFPAAFNRYMAHIHAAVSKTYFSGWPRLLVGNILSLPRTLLAGLQGYWLPGAILFVAVVACAGLLWSRVSRPGNDGRQRPDLLGLVTSAAIALPITVCVYSAAGYGFQPLGADSRTLFPLCLWFTLLFFAAVCSLFLEGARATKTVLLASSFALVAVLVLAQRDHVAEWARAWREEQRILQDAPLNAISRLPSEAAIFYIGPTNYKGVAIFDAPWDLTAAIHWHPIQQTRRPYQHLTMIYPALGGSNWSWDGKTLARTGASGGTRYAVKRLFIWRERLATLEEVQPGFEWRRTKRKTSLQ